MGFPPRNLGDEAEQLSGANPKDLRDRRSPDVWMAADREHTTVVPGSISRRKHAQRQPHPIVEHIPRLRRYARALVRDRDAADDLVQDTLERVANNLRLWRPDSDMRAWLLSVLHNVFINQSRKYRPAVAFDPQQLPEVVGEPTQSEGLLIAEVEKALEAISAEQRAVLLLVVLEQMTYEEVAKALSLPIGTVMSRLSHARDHLRRLTSGSDRL